MFGRLNADLLPTDPIIIGAVAFMALAGIAIVGSLFYFKKWTWLYKNWLTTVDHKKIGVMYIILAIIMLVRGMTDAIMMRGQQAISFGAETGFLNSHHFDQVFTAHGVIMIFFMAMPFMFGLMNVVIPLQIGARDVAFPFLNAVSFWLAVVGAMLVNMSLAIGEFAATGWLAYPPLANSVFSPTVGMDYYLWSLQISGVGTLIGGVNFIVTIFKMRAPGMTLMKMPIFVWTSLSSIMLILISFPIFTVAITLLFLDRYIGTHFFTTDFGGNPMMYINLIWAWGHPEVYILILPAFGIYSEVISVFARKKLFGYTSMVWATMAISILSFLVWVHHFFTMGAGGRINAVFGIATMIIAIPTGVKMFNWLFTMYRGRITFASPMVWSIGFLVVFVFGGMTGVLLATPPADFQFHNSLFLVAHFHNTIIGGVVYGYLAGLAFWFPKVFGFKLNEKLGKIIAACWIGGFFIAFVPVYIAGLLGATRRISHYEGSYYLQPYFIIGFIGALIITTGIFLTVVQLIVSIRDRKKLKADADTWVDGRTLEWSIPSPAPFYNFATIPHVDSVDQHWENKQRNVTPKVEYEDIHMPKNSFVPVVIGGISFLMGTAFIFYINWLAIVTVLAIIVTVIYRVLDTDKDYILKASEVKEIEEKLAKGAM